MNIVVLILLASMPLGAVSALGAQDARRVVIATNVVCRNGPGRSATPIASLDLGESFTVRRVARAEPDTADWILADSPRRYGECWVFSPLTAPFDPSRPEAALAAIANHILEVEERGLFEEYVRVENLFTEPPYRGIDVEGSPELSLRRLQVIDGALSTVDRWIVARDPLKYSWILFHGDILRSNEPGGNWYVDREVYWQLYEKFRDTAWADELAWEAASQPIGGECEGFMDCYLERILTGVAEYWRLFPKGAYVADAISLARWRAEVVVEHACTEERTTVSMDVVNQLRESMEAVAEVAKGPLLSDLDVIERMCRE